jgi:hypothetical protein
MARQVRAMLALQAAGCADLRLRQQHPRHGAGRRRGERLRLQGLRAALYPPAVLRGRGPFRWVALSGDPEDIWRPTPRPASCFRTRPACIAGWTARASASASRGCRRASAGSATRSATGSASPSTRWSPAASSRADRHRPRSPRLRLRRLAEPRDRGDARRLGRGRRLAGAECAAEHRERRLLGQLPSRRGRGHGLLAARGRRGRRGRQRARRRSSWRACWSTIPAPA